MTLLEKNEFIKHVEQSRPKDTASTKLEKAKVMAKSNEYRLSTTIASERKRGPLEVKIAW